MLYHNEIDASEGVDANKIIVSKERILYHYWYFLDKRLRFQPAVCKCFHDVLKMSVDFDNIAILNIQDADYRYLIFGISKCQTINVLKTADLREKKDRYENMFSYIKDE